MTLSKLHEKCKKCKHKDDCDNKRMEACGVMTLSPDSQITNPNMTTSISLEDIQISTSLEEDINKYLEKKLNKEINCNFIFDEFRGLK